ncbi:hypothetical protein TruAng_003386 [Truncatella angustata]|nr:hypothetical protein TruAng_003386 [Truncatella angustata]
MVGHGHAHMMPCPDFEISYPVTPFTNPLLINKSPEGKPLLHYMAAEQLLASGQRMDVTSDVVIHTHPARVGYRRGCRNIGDLVEPSESDVSSDRMDTDRLEPDAATSHIRTAGQASASRCTNRGITKTPNRPCAHLDSGLGESTTQVTSSDEEDSGNEDRTTDNEDESMSDERPPIR